MELVAQMTSDDCPPPAVVSSVSCSVVVAVTTSAHHSYQTLPSSDRLHMLQFTVAPGGTRSGSFSGKNLFVVRATKKTRRYDG